MSEKATSLSAGNWQSCHWSTSPWSSSTAVGPLRPDIWWSFAIVNGDGFISLTWWIKKINWSTFFQVLQTRATWPRSCHPRCLNTWIKMKMVSNDRASGGFGPHEENNDIVHLLSQLWGEALNWHNGVRSLAAKSYVQVSWISISWSCICQPAPNRAQALTQQASQARQENNESKQSKRQSKSSIADSQLLSFSL